MHKGFVAGILALSLAAPMASAQDLGQEWQALTAEESRIDFYVPDLATQNVRFLRSQSENMTYTMEYADWRGPEARHVKAVVLYYRLSPGYYYRRRIDAASLIKHFNAFENKQVSFGESDSMVNDLGRISYQMVGFEDVSCVLFAQQWGAGESGHGDRQIGGYYCSDPGEVLEESAAAKIVKAVRIK